MARLYPIIRRVIVAAGGAINVHTIARAGTRARNAMTVQVESLRVATARLSGPTTVTMPTRPAVRAATTATGTTTTGAATGHRATVSADSDFAVDPGEGGARLGQLVVALARTSGATGVTEEAVAGRTDWASDTNALGNTTATATIAGDAIGARGGRLRFTYAPWTGKDHMTVTRCELRFYVSQAGTVLDNADLRLGHGFPTQATDLTITGNANYLTTPYVVNILSQVSVLSDLDDLVTTVSFESAVAETFTATCARVLVYAEASDTVTP